MFVSRNLIDRIFPFFILVLINFLIIRTLKREHQRFSVNEHRMMSVSDVNNKKILRVTFFLIFQICIKTWQFLGCNTSFDCAGIPLFNVPNFASVYNFLGGDTSQITEWKFQWTLFIFEWHHVPDDAFIEVNFLLSSTVHISKIKRSEVCNIFKFLVPFDSQFIVRVIRKLTRLPKQQSYTSKQCSRMPNLGVLNISQFRLKIITKNLQYLKTILLQLQ